LAECPGLDAKAALDKILDLYEAKMETTPPVLDGLGRIVQEAIDHWEPRQGLALALEYLAPRFTDASMVSHKIYLQKI
jgi:hypothetical protein